MRITVIFVLSWVVPQMTSASDLPVKVYVNGKLQNYTPPARVRAGKTYVPLRQGAISLGYSVKWVAEQNMAQICSDTACVVIRKKEGIVVRGRLFLPLRKMAEAFGAKAEWDSRQKVVRIQKGTKRKLRLE